MCESRRDEPEDDKIGWCAVRRSLPAPVRRSIRLCRGPVGAIASPMSETTRPSRSPRPAAAIDSLRLLETRGFADYRLLDSGNARKLERFGRVIVDRPEPQALWSPRLPPDRWQARTAGGEVGLGEYLAKFVEANPELLPARRLGGSGSVGAGRGEEGSVMDVDSIRPGMDPAEMERARREVARVISRSLQR